MSLYILSADNSKQMDKLEDELSNHKFKTLEKQNTQDLQ